MTEPVPEAPLDLEAVEQFAGNLLTTFTAGMTTLMIDLADRTGLLDALATGPGTSTELAARTGLTERYVRECLAALATAEIVGYDARDGRFTLPPEHAACLTGPGSGNLAPIARLTTLLAPHVAGVARAQAELHRGNGGGPWDAFLAVAFPHDEVQVLPYNRVVRDLGGLTSTQLLAALRQRVELRDGPAVPARRGDVALYLDGRWHTLGFGDPPADLPFQCALLLVNARHPYSS